MKSRTPYPAAMSSVSDGEGHGPSPELSPEPALEDGVRRLVDWPAHDVRRLRSYLGETQAEFADRLGTRQQTVSEWETGASRPRRIARRLLQLVAEEGGFYTLAEAPPAEPASSIGAPAECAPAPEGAEGSG
jgi:DNA-binding XRE family transcriptional regulator